jgi:hypothetical protein
MAVADSGTAAFELALAPLAADWAKWVRSKKTVDLGQPRRNDHGETPGCGSWTTFTANY